MKSGIMFQALALMVFSALTVSAQAPSVVIVPAVASIPVIARLATTKRLPMPACNGEVIVHKRDAIVCAMPGIDWSAYGKVEVVSVDVATKDMKRPLAEQEIKNLTNTLTQSLQRQFDTPRNAADGAGANRTLALRATVTEVRRTNNALNIFTLAAIQSPVSFGGASAHFELSDAESGQVLARIDLSGRGRLYDAFSGTCSLGHAQKALGRMPKEFEKDVKTLRSRSSAQETAALQPPAGIR